MQERDGVASAGDTDEIAMVWREVAEEVFWFDQLRRRRHTANVQRSTFNVQRSIKGRRRMEATMHNLFLELGVQLTMNERSFIV